MMRVGVGGGVGADGGSSSQATMHIPTANNTVATRIVIYLVSDEREYPSLTHQKTICQRAPVGLTVGQMRTIRSG